MLVSYGPYDKNTVCKNNNICNRNRLNLKRTLNAADIMFGFKNNTNGFCHIQLFYKTMYVLKVKIPTRSFIIIE